VLVSGYNNFELLRKYVNTNSLVRRDDGDEDGDGGNWDTLIYYVTVQFV